MPAKRKCLKKLMTTGNTREGMWGSEPTEMVGGYLIINAADYNEAVSLSKECPIFEHNGTIEVREILPMEG